MVFQQFNLFPNMTVLENLCLAPVTLGKLSKEEAKIKAIDLLGNIHLLDKKMLIQIVYLVGRNRE